MLYSPRIQAQSPPLIVNFEEFQHTLTRDNDTLYVVNFWATWCAPCVKELPFFERMHEEFADANVKVVLVSLDFDDRLDNSLYPFIAKHNLQSEVIVLDDPKANQWIPKVDDSWSGAIPATLAFQGDTRVFKTGSFATYEELKAFIQPLKYQP